MPLYYMFTSCLQDSIGRVIANAQRLRSLKLHVQWIPDDSHGWDSRSAESYSADIPSYAYKRSSDLRSLHEPLSPDDTLSRFSLQQATDMMLLSSSLRVIGVSSVLFTVSLYMNVWLCPLLTHFLEMQGKWVLQQENGVVGLQLQVSQNVARARWQ